MCYDLANDKDLVLSKVKAHQVRALAASEAFYNNAPIDYVLEACTWACHNTFSSFYLKNLSESHSSGYRLSPFVADYSVVRYIFCVFVFWVSGLTWSINAFIHILVLYLLKLFHNFHTLGSHSS